MVAALVAVGLVAAGLVVAGTKRLVAVAGAGAPFADVVAEELLLVAGAVPFAETKTWAVEEMDFQQYLLVVFVAAWAGLVLHG